MGNAESTAATGGFAKVGYHVLLVSHGSPSDNILQPFWDIIVGSQGHVFDKDDSALVQLFQTHLNKPLTLTVYSMKTEKTREVTIVPNNTWGTGGLAGIIIRFGNFAPLLELVWHVLDVYVDSPASEAQLVSRSDFIIGIPEKAFKDPEDFFNYINSHLRQTVQLFVYNSSSEQVRTVSITPNNEWGGNGVLGCDIGYGYLHRIPTRMTISRTASPSISPSPIPPSSSSSSSVPPSPSPSPVPFVSSSSSSIPPVSPSVSSSSSSSTSTPSTSTPVSSVSPSLSSIPPVRFSPTPLPETTNYPIPTNYTAFSPLSPLSPIAPYNPDIPYSFSSLPPLPPAFTPTPLPYLVGENSSNSPLQQNSIMTPITEGLEQVKL